MIYQTSGKLYIVRNFRTTKNKNSQSIKDQPDQAVAKDYCNRSWNHDGRTL